MKAETIIYCLFSALKPFRRNKIPPEKKIRAAELYLQGFSYRQVAEILGISHTTVWETVQKFAKTIYQPKILAVWITTTRNWWIARDFILVVLKSCERQPVFLVDGGPWYKSAFKSLRLDFVHVTFGPRNSIERWFRTVKERTKRFWNNFRSGAGGGFIGLFFCLSSGIILLGVILGLVNHLVMLVNGFRR